MTRHIAIFASGNGSNAENIIRHFNYPVHDTDIKVALVVCNRADAGVIGKADNLGVPVMVLGRTEINNPDIMEPLLAEYKTELIVLAGFLLMVPEFLTERYAGRIINIHPSLLPKFGGKGMYGRHVHKAVVEAGERVTGITVHMVSNEYDKGKILFQATTEVLDTDTPDSVEKKIHELERKYFPMVIEKVAENDLLNLSFPTT